MRKQQFEKVMNQAKELLLMGASKDLLKHFFNDFGVNLSNYTLEDFITRSKY